MAKLVVNVGSMFSGKSTELIRQGERHLLAGHKVVFIKPNTDTRYSNNKIVTHTGASVEATVVDVNKSFFVNVKDTDVVLIDEVQFFTERIIPTIWCLLDCGIDVYCSGLDMDYLGNGFETVNELMAMADTVNKIHAVCKHCGEDAVLTAKKNFHEIVGDQKRVELGSDDLYVPLCRDCYIKFMTSRGDKKQCKDH